MPSALLFFFSFQVFPFCIPAYSQLADQYGADIANIILKRNRSKSLRDSTSTSSTGTPHYSHRNDTPLYPFKSKYSQQSSSLYTAH